MDGCVCFGRNTGKKDSLQWSENIRMFVYGRHKQLAKAYFDSNGINTKELAVVLILWNVDAW